jgi:hypothetical protein
MDGLRLRGLLAAAIGGPSMGSEEVRRVAGASLRELAGEVFLAWLSRLPGEGPLP